MEVALSGHANDACDAAAGDAVVFGQLGGCD